jgi:hypothetical protein
MATNELERAVIAAARSWRARRTVDHVADAAFFQAIDALDAHERSQDPTVTERGWHEVVAGDEVKSIKNGRFYKVLSTLKVRGGYRITLQTGDKQTPITRPTEAEPTATVRRGPTGQAADLLTTVLASG